MKINILFKRIFITCCLSVFLIALHNPKASAAFNFINNEQTTGTMPDTAYNLNSSEIKSSRLVATANGYMRVFEGSQKVCIEYYDASFNLLSKKAIAMELPIWGGFYASSNAYYVAVAQDNTEQKDDNEVIRVIKYDTNWNKLGAAKLTGNSQIYGGAVGLPFVAGGVEFAESAGKLYLVTGHEGYVDPVYNQGHQGFLMYEIDENTMTGKIAACDYMHSLSQYIASKDDILYVMEQSEGSRCAKLTKYDGNYYVQNNTLAGKEICLLQYGGSRTSAWAIPCYATTDDMAISSNNILCIGSSIDQKYYDSATSDTSRNIYLTITPVSDFSEEATTFKWITNHTDDGLSIYNMNLTKINDNRFMISWRETGTFEAADNNDGLSSNRLYYIFIDGNGNVISKKFTENATLSDCRPIVKGANVVFYASNNDTVDFYSINSTTGHFSKRVYRVAGPDATWEFNNGTLTISGKGALTSYSDDDTAFVYDSGWDSVRDITQKIIIKKGITNIPASCFCNFSKLTSVDIEDGLTSIGSYAFSYCNSLTSVSLPDSIQKIGDRIMWSGRNWSYNGSPIHNGSIYAPYNSVAIQYAKDNGINYLIDIASAKPRISGLKKTYSCTGDYLLPKLNITLGNVKLVENVDYILSYSKNKKPGKATINVLFINNYYGKATKTFIIVPKKAVLTKAVSPKKKCLLVKWKRDSQATGYQLQLALNKNFSSGKKTITLTNNKATSKTITKLKRGKKYYIRIRSYKLINKKKYYGSWSKLKTARCK